MGKSWSKKSSSLTHDGPDPKKVRRLLGDPDSRANTCFENVEQQDAQVSNMGVRVLVSPDSHDEGQLIAKSTLVQSRCCISWVGEQRLNFSSVRMAFVNRIEPVKILTDCFMETYKARYEERDGDSTQIPVIVSSSGMGSKRLVYEFPRLCGSLEKSGRIPSQFQDIMKRARVIRLKLSISYVCDAIRLKSVDKTIRTEFVDLLRGLIYQGKLRGDVDFLDNKTTLRNAVRAFMSCTNTPLLLMINLADTGELVSEPHKLLGGFVQGVIRTLLQIPDLFVVLGVGENVYNWIDQGGCGSYITRINLHCIRERYLDQILRESLNEGVPLVQFYKLDTAEKMTKAKNAIMKATNGHPYSMQTMFSECSTLENLETFNCEAVWAIRKDWSCALHRHYRSISVLVSAISERSIIDLTTPVVGLGTLETLVDLAYIRKEGTITCAKLYAADCVRAELELIIFPFREWLSRMLLDRSPYFNFYYLFEMSVLKIFQEKFSRPFSPGGWGEWFVGTEFAKLPAFTISRRTLQIPKVTGKSGIAFENLDQKTVSPKEFKKVYLYIQNQPGCYIPRVASASSDLIIITTTDKKIITIGIAVKCIANPLGVAQYYDEMRKFDRMFASGRQEQEFRVLLVVSTGGFVSWIVDKQSEVDPPGYPNVDEVIPIDIRDKRKREQFFDLVRYPDLAEKIEIIVQKGNDTESVYDDVDCEE